MSGYGADALKVTVLKALADDVEDALKAGKTGLLHAMHDDGVEKIAARLPDGTKVASLPLCGGEPKPRVTDPEAFLAWVRANRPGEIEERVRDSFTKAVLTDAERVGKAVSRDTGEVIPGIGFEPTTPYVQVLFANGEPSGRELIRRAHRDGKLDILAVALPGDATPAIEGGAA